MQLAGGFWPARTVPVGLVWSVNIQEFFIKKNIYYNII